MLTMKTIATHDGKFHPDDVFAAATIMLVEGKENVSVIRDRDMEVIKTADWVVDVGGIHDVETFRFDHHQNGAPVRENGIAYAAFGLVWKEFGEQIAGSQILAEKIDRELAQPIDAGDNGISLTSENSYGIYPAEVYSVISSFIPGWGSDKDIDEAFLEAVDFAYNYLVRLIERGQSEVAMYEYADSLYEAAEQKEIIVADKAVSSSAFIKYPEVVAVVSSREEVDFERWMTSPVPTEAHSFERRKYFPQAWSGLKDSELEAVSGIKGALFCHKNLFLFVADNKEAALQAAKILV